MTEQTATPYEFVPPAADGLPTEALDSATRGADMLDAWALTPNGRNFLAHALVQLQRDGWLREEPNVTRPVGEEPAVAAPANDDRHQRYADVLRRWGLLDEVNDPKATAAFVTTDLLSVADAEQADLRAQLADAKLRAEQVEELLDAAHQCSNEAERRRAAAVAALDRVRDLRDTWRGYAIVHWQTSQLLDELTRALDPQPTTPQEGPRP